MDIPKAELPKVDLHYSRETRSCRAKRRMWAETGSLEPVRKEFGEDASIDMCKSLILQYPAHIGTRYVMACLPSRSRLDLRELRAELPLDERAKTELRLADSVRDVTPRARGAIAPTDPGIVDVVYFTRDFMKQQDSVYDVAVGLDQSFFMRGSDLLEMLDGERYLRPGPSDFDVVDWGHPRECDVEKAGYPLDFSSAVVDYKGSRFVIKTPPKDDRGCIALIEGSRARATLPIEYATLHSKYEV